jgi:uncharacterized phage infection (PIP) family protein YhgE
MWNSSGRIIIIVVLVLLLSFALEMYPLGLTAVFGQNSHPSNQSPSSSAVLSENQKITSSHLIILYLLRQELIVEAPV